jgi:AICAR transformylase/IMP cyclohydrolase PurH
VGLGETAAEAYGKAFETDPMSAYGGVIGLNVPVDGDAATAIIAQFVEAIVAPTFTAEAQEILAAKKHIRPARGRSAARLQSRRARSEARERRHPRAGVGPPRRRPLPI